MKRTLLLLGFGMAGSVIGAGLLMQSGPDLPRMLRVDDVNDAALYVQIDEVTLDEWNRCHDAGGCELHLTAPKGAGFVDYPATGLSYTDAQQYITWFSGITGHVFRLPTAIEWWALAADIIPEKPDPIFDDPELLWASAYVTEGQISRQLRPTGSYTTTSDGIRDLDGNVWEWTQDCYAGSAGRMSADRCPAYYVGGVHEAVISFLVRDPARGGCAVGSPPAHLGLRLVTDSAVPTKN